MLNAMISSSSYEHFLTVSVQLRLASRGPRSIAGKEREESLLISPKKHRGFAKGDSGETKGLDLKSKLNGPKLLEGDKASLFFRTKDCFAFKVK